MQDVTSTLVPSPWKELQNALALFLTNPLLSHLSLIPNPFRAPAGQPSADALFARLEELHKKHTAKESRLSIATLSRDRAREDPQRYSGILEARKEQPPPAETMPEMFEENEFVDLIWAGSQKKVQDASTANTNAENTAREAKKEEQNQKKRVKTLQEEIKQLKKSETAANKREEEIRMRLNGMRSLDDEVKNHIEEEKRKESDMKRELETVQQRMSQMKQAQERMQKWRLVDEEKERTRAVRSDRDKLTKDLQSQTREYYQKTEDLKNKKGALETVTNLVIRDRTALENPTACSAYKYCCWSCHNCCCCYVASGIFIGCFLICAMVLLYADASISFKCPFKNYGALPFVSATVMVALSILIIVSICTDFRVFRVFSLIRLGVTLVTLPIYLAILEATFYEPSHDITALYESSEINGWCSVDFALFAIPLFMVIPILLFAHIEYFIQVCANYYTAEFDVIVCHFSSNCSTNHSSFPLISLPFIERPL